MTDRKRVMVLGASRYYSKSIESVRKAGYRVIAVDRNPQSDAFAIADGAVVCDIIDKPGVLEAARREKIDGIVSVNDFGVPTAAFVASRLGLSGISEDAAFLATDKKAMRARWMADGVPCPRVAHGTTPAEIRAAVAHVTLPCVLKPAHGIGGGSRGVVVVSSESELDSAIEFAQRFYEDKEVLVESFIDSEFEHSAETVVHHGDVHVLALSDKVKSPLPYRVDMHVLYPSKVTGARFEQLKDVCTRAIRSLGIDRGAVQVELATTKTGFSLFELGARCGGGGTPEPICTHVSGVNQFLQHVKIAVGDTDLSLEPMSERACSYNFIVLTPGRIRTIRDDFDQVRNHPRVLDAGLLAKPGQTINRLSNGADRAGFTITTGETPEDAMRLGTELERMVHVEYQ